MGEGVEYAWAEVGVDKDTPTEALTGSVGGENSCTHFSSWLLFCSRRCHMAQKLPRRLPPRSAGRQCKRQQAIGNRQSGNQAIRQPGNSGAFGFYCREAV